MSPLTPFGMRLDVAAGTTFADLDPAELKRLLLAHRVVLIRGLVPEGPVRWPASVRALGALQAWPFGAVHEVKVDPDAENYLYTRNRVPLHWDGAFKGEVPGILAFACVAAPGEGAGGATVFVDTTRVWEAADEPTRARWRRARFAYQTERKAHYGGRFEADLLAEHPHSGDPVLRYAEPVNDLNPVAVTALTPQTPDHAALADALANPSVVLRHEWLPGDVLLADNHRLLHGRDAFAVEAPRHLLRVNILDRDRSAFTPLLDALRIRRLEFLLAELPIPLIAGLLLVDEPAALLQAPFLATAGALALLYQAGDMANCLADRELDVAAKTDLAEAMRRLGTRNVWAQIGLSVLGALALAATAGPAVFALTLLGAVLGAGYSLPPLAFKNRGLWQLPYSAGILFVGPMVLVDVALTGSVHVHTLLIATAFAALQQGALLVNVAEDIREDTFHGIRTAAVVLGAHRTIQLARAMVALAAPALAITLAWPLTGRPLLALATVLPLLLAAAWCLLAIHRLSRKIQRRPDEARDLIRKTVPELPGWLAFHAWAALIPAAVALW